MCIKKERNKTNKQANKHKLQGHVLDVIVDIFIMPFGKFKKKNKNKNKQNIHKINSLRNKNFLGVDILRKNVHMPPEHTAG